MMEKKSGFQFDNFIIKRSLFEIKEEVEISDLSVAFKPSGRIDYDKGLFHLELSVKISDPNENFNIEIDSLGFFKFDGIKKEELSSFLFHNAPALLFPYLRAYISSLTTLSGIQPIVLPTLNLSNLKPELEKNMVEQGLTE